MNNEQINPAFWLEVIRTNAYVTDCSEKSRSLVNAAEKLGQYIAALAPPSGEGVDDAMVERACKRYAFREDGAVFPDDYSDNEAAAERVLMREFLTHVIGASTTPQSAPVDGPKLHFATRQLVDAFSIALAEKLAAAEAKYGYSDGWRDPSWMDECRAKLLEHVAKGDPQDVAAYCAFLWHHGEPTSKPKQAIVHPGPYSDDDLTVIVQDWDESDPDQAVAINLAREVLRYRTTPPPASQERGGDAAPWPDFAGNPIHAGDRIKHPDGVSGTVVYLPMLGPSGEAWRVVYDGEAILSRLCLQIGDKGRAVVLSPNCGVCGETIKPDPLTGTTCACAASPPSSSAENQWAARSSASSSPAGSDDAVEGSTPSACPPIDAAEQAKPHCPICAPSLAVEMEKSLRRAKQAKPDPVMSDFPSDALPKWPDLIHPDMAEQALAGEVYEEVAEFLNGLGWQARNDAQWHNLRDSLPQLAALLRRLAGGVTAPYKLTMRSGVASCNDNPIGYFTDERTAYLVGDLIRAIDKNDHPEYSGFDVVAASGAK